VRSTATIVYGVSGQTLEIRALEGRASSATFDVLPDFAGDDDEPEFSGTGTVDSVSTTVSAASGQSQTDPQKVSLTSTSSIVTGRKYLLAENSLREWVEPVSIHSGYIRVRHPLKNDYTTSATFVGTTITASVDATWAAAEENISDHLDPNPDYRVRWEYVVSGATCVAYSFFDLVRATVAHRIDIDDINARAPGLHDSIPIEYREEQGRPLVDAAWRAVQAKLASLSIDTDALRDNQILDELTILKALNVLAVGGWRPPAYASQLEYIEVTSQQFDRFIEQHFQVTLKHRLASGSSGGSDTRFAVPVWVK
jgi:hypothetical protein